MDIILCDFCFIFSLRNFNFTWLRFSFQHEPQQQQQNFERANYYVILELCLSGLISFRCVFFSLLFFIHYKLTFFSGIYLFTLHFDSLIIYLRSDLHASRTGKWAPSTNYVRYICLCVNSYVCRQCGKSMIFSFSSEWRKKKRNYEFEKWNECTLFRMFWWIIIPKKKNNHKI